MRDWRSGYAPADAGELELASSELGATRPPMLQRRTRLLAAAGFVAVGLLLGITTWAGGQRWRPRSSSRLASNEVEQANEDHHSSEFEVNVQAVDAKVSGADRDQHEHPGTERHEDSGAEHTAESSAEQSSGKEHEKSRAEPSHEEEESEYTSSEWEVIIPGFAFVRKAQDFKAAILAKKLSGSIVVGRRSVDNDKWLALIHEPGFMAMSVKGKNILKQRSVSYSRVLRGACKDVSKHPIYDANTCQNAGFALGYFDTNIGIYHGELDRPEGCYEYRGQLWVSTNPLHQGKGAMGDRKPICSSNSYPTTTTTTTTKTTTTGTFTTTTTTTTTWGSPSLFCIEVVRTHGFELPLVKAQQRVRASIFSCDEYRVFSDGGKTEVIGVGPDGLDITTIVIPPIKKKKMALDFKAGVTTNSWLNTETFLQVWHLAQEKDGRMLRHDWVVKVDPDAVFFPDRLRAKLRPHTQRGVKAFVMNCDKYTPIALYGSLEIFSAKAMKTYIEGQWNCRTQLKWHGWGEDFYMSHCMDHLGVQRIYDFSLIGDARCHYAPCDDITKVVYHDYKNQSSWFACWHKSCRAEGLHSGASSEAVGTPAVAG